MTKFKQWLYNRFLPAWCKEELMEKNGRLTKRVKELEQEREVQEAYTDGLERALQLLGGRR